MTDRIQLHELQSAIEKAAKKVLTRQLPGHRPIILGFVAPDGTGVAEAEAIAKEVVAEFGLKGTPTVFEGAAQAGQQAGHERKAAALKIGPIIIGLVFDPRS